MLIENDRWLKVGKHNALLGNTTTGHSLHSIGNLNQHDLLTINT